MQNSDTKSALQNDIVTCRLTPGTPLQESALSNRYSCGRTKIRDALLMLAAENFITLAPNKGAIVAPLDATQVFSIFEMRLAIEKAAAVLAAKRISDAGCKEMEALRATILKARNSGDEDFFYQTDRQVHDLISQATLNVLIQQQMELMRLHTRRCWYFYKDRGFEEVADYDGLIALIDAICKKNPEAAGTAMFRHLSHFHQSFTDMFARQIRGLEHV